MRAGSSDLPFKLQRAEAEYPYPHPGQDDDVDPEIGQARAAQHYGPLQLDVVGRRQDHADGPEDPGHGLAREDETGEEHRRQDEDNAHLQRLNLVRAHVEISRPMLKSAQR